MPIFATEKGWCCGGFIAQAANTRCRGISYATGDHRHSASLTPTSPRHTVKGRVSHIRRWTCPPPSPRYFRTAASSTRLEPGPTSPAGRPERTLRLLDLTGTWPLRNGASYSINMGRRDRCRAWARLIHATRPDLDGLWHHSTMTGKPLVTLFTPGADTFPPSPLLSVPLADPGLRPWQESACHDVGFDLV